MGLSDRGRGRERVRGEARVLWQRLLGGGSESSLTETEISSLDKRAQRGGGGRCREGLEGSLKKGPSIAL